MVNGLSSDFGLLSRLYHLQLHIRHSCLPDYEITFWSIVFGPYRLEGILLAYWVTLILYRLSEGYKGGLPWSMGKCFCNLPFYPRSHLSQPWTLFTSTTTLFEPKPTLLTFFKQSFINLTFIRSNIYSGEYKPVSLIRTQTSVSSFQNGWTTLRCPRTQKEERSPFLSSYFDNRLSDRRVKRRWTERTTSDRRKFLLVDDTIGGQRKV